MSLVITIDLTDLDEAGLAGVQAKLTDLEDFNAAIAGGVERFVKLEVGPRVAATQHRTADTLGGQRTGHLERAYQAIEVSSDAQRVTMDIPGSSRLAAAFGDVHITPGPGVGALTIPISGAAYGHRAREFDDLFMFVSKKGNRVLARLDLYGDPEPMFVLVASADIPADPTLIPFDELGGTAVDAGEEYFDNLIEEQLT